MESMSMGWRSRQSVAVNEARWISLVDAYREDFADAQAELASIREELAKVTAERNGLFDQCRVLRLENRRLENELSMRALQD